MSDPNAHIAANVTPHKDAPTMFIIWSVIAGIVFAGVLTLSVLRYAGKEPHAAFTMTVVGLTLVYSIVSCIWWALLYGKNEPVQ